jgi:hypothetical protein
MQIRDAPARRGAGVFMVNRVPDRRPARANHLRRRAVKVGETDTIDPLQRAENAVAIRCYVCGCDTDERTPGDDENDCEIAQLRNGTAGDLRQDAS